MADDAPKRNREDFATTQHRVLRETIAKSEADEQPGIGSIEVIWHPLTMEQRTTDRSRDSEMRSLLDHLPSQ
jgi:hypothetical protein